MVAGIDSVFVTICSGLYIALETCMQNKARMSFDGYAFRLPLSKLPQLSPIRANKDPQVLLGAQLIWAQSCYDGILPSLTSFEPPDTPSTEHLFTSPTPEPSSSPPPPPPPPPQVLRLRLRDVTAASVDGYAYQGCMIDDSSNRVLGAARIDNNNMAPTLCRNL